MASSDDEDELVPQSVTNYFFEDSNDDPVSFSVLPFYFDAMEKKDSSKEHVFLRGTGDSGCEKVYKEVTAWKLNLEDAQPEIMVHTKGGKWIKLLKPRKSYESIIRTVLITTQLLHYLRRNPQSSEKSVWDHLRRAFSSFDDLPIVNDLIDHYPLIKMLIERDDALAKSQLLLMLLKEKPRKKFFGEDLQNDLDSKKSFIVDDDLEDDMGNDDRDESDDEPDLFDSVCAICDNGGELLCCEGRCMRSFHATKEDGEDSDCKSLGFSKEQVEDIQNFLCENCKYKKHQCFICGKLGSSDKSTGAEVFSCVNATCGYFYHPKCVAGLLFPEDKTEAAECEKKIAGGESFACPVHKCLKCKQGENKEVKELQFAVCRRCPRSYHRKCLPTKIAFEDIEEEEILQRAWEDLLPNRVLIYCLKHKIDEDLGTPIRNHIIFPENPERRKIVDVQKNKLKVLVKKIKKVSGNLGQERTSVNPVKLTEKLSSLDERQPAVRGGSITQQMRNIQKQLKSSKVGSEPGLHSSDGSALLDSKKPPKGEVNAAVPITTLSNAKVAISSFPKIDIETQNRMIALMKSASSSLTLADVTRKRMMPSTHTQTVRNVDRGITLGKVEGSVEAVKTALKKLEDGGNVEDAKAVCEPEILRQIMRWNNRLKVYLAPFLHGMRYTSFGRHFTKVDKLKEIVDKLQWYVQNGDTIVDFCCGANDFSRLMKDKLDAAGKRCSYKNFDVIQPKYDFNFEKKDWMTVQPKELPTGSQLIMGLNPPFGVKASLANKFIDKALTFKPKLIILIVPSETERLDKKRSPYDLIWEDCEKLSGKSFYLPGSVDVNDMQIEQWNNKPPPLYLWSRPDWTTNHKAIAMKQGHISNMKHELPVEEEKFRVAHSPEGPENMEAVTGDRIPNEENKIDAESKNKIDAESKNKIDTESKKSSPPENHSSRSRQKTAKRKAQREAKRRKLEDEVGKKEAVLSDMSISPPNTLDKSNGQVPMPTVETPRESFQTFADRPNSVVVEDIQDIVRRYATPSVSTTYNWSNDMIGDHRDYMIRNSEERFSGYNSSVGYGRSLDVDTRVPQARFSSGISDSVPRFSSGILDSVARFSPGISDSALGHSDLLSSSYGLSNSTVGSSVMQRYAPRLDEMSFPSGVDDVGRNNGRDMHGTTGNLPPDAYGFAQGPQRQYQHHNSGGWLDD